MPSPWIIRSVLRPVVWLEPWLKLVLVAASWTPSPTWIGLLPPRLAAALGEEPEVSICDSVSEKTVELDLKPTVLALAMLLPVTSSMTWLTRRPLMPAKRERSMVVLLVRCRDQPVVAGGVVPAAVAEIDWIWPSETLEPSTTSIGPLASYVTEPTRPEVVVPS